MKNIYITSGVVLLALVLAFSLYLPVSAQNSRWYGSPGAPFWNKTWQGSTILFGSVTCTQSGPTFLSTSARFRQSLIIRNRGTVEVFICPASAALCDIKANALANAFNLLENEALVLDKSNNAAGSAGWKCFTDTGTSDVRYFVEEGY